MTHIASGYSDPRAATVSPDEVARDRAVAGAGAGPISLPQLALALTAATAKAYALTKHQWDPTTGPQQTDPYAVGEVDLQLAAVAADLRSALSGLDGLRNLTRPAPGHATTGAPVPASSESDGSATAAGASSDPIASGVRVAVPALAGSVSAGAHRAPRSAHRTGGDGVGFTTGAAPMGASFTLPVTKRFEIPGTSEIAAGINAALARRSR